MHRSVSAAALFSVPPQLRFRSRRGFCPCCHAALKVGKTLRREVRTLHIGPFTAHETVLHCGCAPETRTFRSEELAELVAPGCNLGHDVMAYAGEAVLRRNRTVEQTVAELAARNVRICPSEVRGLLARFVVALGIAHAEAAPRLRACLQQAGGWILHLDSTCKGGSAHLLTGIDEISGFVLLNAKIPSESSEAVALFLRDLTVRFGLPAAVSCDMSKGILGALAAVLPEDIPVFVCHFHFLRDLGKDLLGQHYETIRKGLRSHGLKAELKRMQRALRDQVEANAERIGQLLQAIERRRRAPEPACELPCEALLGTFAAAILDAEDQGDGCGFPFDRPHLLLLRQAQAVLDALDALYRTGACKAPDRKLCAQFAELLRPVCTDPAMVAAADALEAEAKHFDQLRQAMRIAEPGAARGLNDPGEDIPIATIRHNVEALCDRLGADPAFTAIPECRAMLAQIDRSGPMLFADPIVVQTPSGKRTIQPQRTNNILERFFRRINRQACKRTGRRPAEAFLDRIMPDAPLVANLDNPRYVEILLNGSDTLSQRLARVDRKLVDDTLATIRKSASGLGRKARAQLRAKATPLKIALYIIENAAA